LGHLDSTTGESWQLFKHGFDNEESFVELDGSQEVHFGVLLSLEIVNY
jgi:hypothetical protein